LMGVHEEHRNVRNLQPERSIGAVLHTSYKGPVEKAGDPS
jgi:hypothetical protein